MKDMGCGKLQMKFPDVYNADDDVTEVVIAIYYRIKPNSSWCEPNGGNQHVQNVCKGINDDGNELNCQLLLRIVHSFLA